MTLGEVYVWADWFAWYLRLIHGGGSSSTSSSSGDRKRGVERFKGPEYHTAERLAAVGAGPSFINMNPPAGMDADDLDMFRRLQEYEASGAQRK